MHRVKNFMTSFPGIKRLRCEAKTFSSVITASWSEENPLTRNPHGFFWEDTFAIVTFQTTDPDGFPLRPEAGQVQFCRLQLGNRHDIGGMRADGDERGS